jgi:hypothetical protein
VSQLTLHSVTVQKIGLRRSTCDKTQIRFVFNRMQEEIVARDQAMEVDISQGSGPAVVTRDLPTCGRDASPPAMIDPAQMEQALLDLLKNAHESGSPLPECPGSGPIIFGPSGPY